MIEAKGVSLRYPNGTIGLKEVNLELNPGELIYITGPSGSGKTSLLKLIMGVEYPTTGSLKVLGQEIKKDQTAGIRHLRMKLGSVFQECADNACICFWLASFSNTENEVF
jgi:cell division transport system ATP-binding protein